MTRLIKENEKKKIRAEQKIHDETGVFKMKQNEIIELSAKLEEENSQKDFLVKKVILTSCIC